MTPAWSARLRARASARPAPGERPWPLSSTTDDDALLARMAAGDLEAMRLVFEHHGALMLMLGRALAGSPAEGEDIVVDVFRRLWATAGALWARGTPLRPWLAAATFEQAQRIGRGCDDEGDGKGDGKAAGVAAVAVVALAGPRARCEAVAARLGTTRSGLGGLLRQGLWTLGDPTEAHRSGA